MCGRLTLAFAAISLSIGPSAMADILVGKFGNEGASGVHRYRESDGADLGTAGPLQAETNQGMTLGPDGMLYIVGNSLGFGVIQKNDPVTAQFLGYVFPLQPATPYQSPNGIAFGNDGRIYSTSQQNSPGGVSGVVRQAFG